MDVYVLRGSPGRVQPRGGWVARENSQGFNWLPSLWQLSRAGTGSILFFNRCIAWRQVFCTNRAWKSPLVTYDAGGWDPGTRSSSPLSSLLWSLFKMDRGLQACHWGLWIAPSWSGDPSAGRRGCGIGPLSYHCVIWTPPVSPLIMPACVLDILCDVFCMVTLVARQHLFFFFLFIYLHVHTLFGPFLPLLPHPPPTLLTSCSALISNFVEEKT
jgi:hypothetical protein